MADFNRIFSFTTSSFAFLVVLVVYFMSTTEPKHYHSLAGPFRIIFRRIENCPQTVQIKKRMELHMKDTRSRHGQEFTFSGNMTVPFVISDRLAVRLTLASWNNVAGWRQNAHMFRIDKYCEMMENYLPEIWHSLFYSVLGEIVPCPIDGGIFRFDNWTFSFKDNPVKHFFYGRWRGDFNVVYPNKETAACLRVEGDTVPK